MFARDMHHIQKDIITSLAHKSPQRFSELQLPSIPNNTFSYHLKKLLQSDYVARTDDGYVATRKTLKALQHASLRDKSANTPAFLTAVCVTNNSGKVLLLQRDTQPFIDYYALPAGLIHQGEHLGDAAARELFEKTTIRAPRLQFAGVLDFRYLQQVSGDLFVHTVAFVYSYHLPGDGGQLSGLKTRYGTLLWSDLGHSRILPEVRAITQLVKQKQPAVESIDFDEPTIKV